MAPSQPSVENCLPAASALLLGAAEIARRICDGVFTSEQIVSAAIANLKAAQQQCRPLTTDRFDQALVEARRADQRQQAGDNLGKLHGVPITVKECFDVAGLATTWGSTGVVSVATGDAVAVQQLQAAGAIVVAKTNVSHQGLFFESDNPRYGRTDNPWDPQRTCGGSSGGEAAAVAACGSALGLATDLGGSIRVPAHFCGVHGLKPTTDAVSTVGFLDNLPGMQAIACVPGPIARTVEDLTLALNTLVDPQQVGRWQKEPASCSATHVDLADVKIGWWEDNGYFSPSPAIRRAVREAVDELEAQGAHIQRCLPPAVDEMMRIYISLISADGGVRLRRTLRGSQRDLRVVELQRLAVLPTWLRAIAATVAQARGHRYLAQILRASGRTSVAGYWQLCCDLNAWREQFRRWWDQSALSAVVCPVFGLPSFPHGRSRDVLPAASYAFLANLLGYPAGTLSITRVREEEETDRSADGPPPERLAATCEQGSAGLPIGVQIISTPWREDIVLAVMRALEIKFRERDDYPPGKLVRNADG